MRRPASSPRCGISAVVPGLISIASAADPVDVIGTEGTRPVGTPLSSFDSPWALTFLSDGRALVTEKGGSLWLLDAEGAKAGEVAGVPDVEPRGQGGLGDVIAAPDFADTGTVFLSYVERDATARRQRSPFRLAE